MKKVVLCFSLFCFFSVAAHAVQIAVFIDDQNPGLYLEGQAAHVAISYKGKWLHANPSRLNGRLSYSKGVHVVQNLTQIGLNFVVYENQNVPDPSEEYYSRMKDKSFNIFAEWNSTTETHCSIIVGKHLVEHSSLKPSKMKFKSSFWRGNTSAQKMRGRLGLSPQEILNFMEADPGFSLYYQSPFSTFKIKAKKLNCSALIQGR